MANEYYNQTSWPVANSKGTSTLARNEMDLIEDGFDKMPTLTASGGYFVRVNTSGTALESITTAVTKTILDLVIGTDIVGQDAELQAIADATVSQDDVPMFDGTAVMSHVDFLDQDSMSSNSATAVASQQSIRYYIDSQYNIKRFELDAPTNTEMLFRGSVPSGWTARADMNGRMIFVDSTAGGTNPSGTTYVDSQPWTSNSTVNDNHYHNISYSEIGGNPSGTIIIDGSGYQYPTDNHKHTFTFSVNTGGPSGAHTHTFTNQVQGAYVQLGVKS